LLHRLKYFTCTFMICIVVYNILYPKRNCSTDLCVPCIKWMQWGMLLF
jgi:hypothetical protein